MNLTDVEEARLLALTVSGTRLALLTAMGDESTAGTEVAGSGYVRRAPSWGAPAGGQIANSAPVLLIDMPACVTYGWELWSDDGLERRWYGYWSPTVTTWDTGVFTATAHGYVDDEPLIFLPGFVPTGLVALTPYYVRDATANTFAVAAAPGGAALAVAGTGSAAFGRVITVDAGESFEIKTGQLVLTMD